MLPNDASAFCYITVIGGPGNGKSALCNALVNMPGRFPESGLPEVQTTSTSTARGLLAGVAGVPVLVTDTPGLDVEPAADTAAMAQLREVHLAQKQLNGLIIAVNAQVPRVDGPTARLVKVMFALYGDNPALWSNVCLFFTKSFKGHTDRDMCRGAFRTRILEEILCQCPGATPLLPCFFADLGMDTLATGVNRDDFLEFQAWLQSRAPVSTDFVHVVRGEYKLQEMQKQTVAVSSDVTTDQGTVWAGGLFGKALGFKKPGPVTTTTTITWEDQERMVRTPWVGEISYGNWETTRRYTSTV